VKDCENRRFVFTNNVADLADRIVILVLANNQRESLGNVACQTIRNKFTMQRELDVNFSL
jgi:hypothetical protein